jgi:hypothetical protein
MPMLAAERPRAAAAPRGVASLALAMLALRLADRARGARRLVLQPGAVTLVQSGIALIAMLPS